MAKRVIKTDCILCINSCGINAYVEDGKLVGVEGMAEHPASEGYICPRGKALVEYVYSPDRVLHPMKKTNGTWQRITWDKALDTIAGELQKIKEEYGARSLAVYNGSIGTENIELAAFAQRFRGAYGTPNLLSVEGNCFRSRIMARQMTFGNLYTEEPWKSRCAVIWGQNMDNSAGPKAAKIYKAMDAGTLKHLIVIDPKRIPMANRGTYIRIRPGTDVALMLGMMNVIISEGLYDRAFIDRCTLGFDKLEEHVRQYTPEKVEKITWVPADDVRKIARIFAANKPAANVAGTAPIDQHINGFQGNRALAILQIITGNVEIPGSWISIPMIKLGDLRLTEISEPIGADVHPLFRRFWGRTSPYGQQNLFADAVLEEEPYAIKAMIVNGGNPALTLPDSDRVAEAMKKLDLLVVMDLFMTETAQLADIFLPACSFLEKSGLGYVYGATWGIPYALLRKKVVEPRGESWPDWKIWSELGRRMGYQEYFPWNSDEEVVDFFLKPSGLTRRQLEEEHPEGAFYVEESKKYLGGTYRTPSGKIEIYSETLFENGYDPLPVYVEPSQSPVSAPKLAKHFPLILTTGARIPQYTHSQLRNIPSLREEAPEPVAEVNPATARKYGIANGDIASIETPKGKICMKAQTVEEMSPGVVSIPHGWPEANANRLTSTDIRDPITGYTEMKALLCRIQLRK
jgi:anaerobic selenocysteine-containing dehydrogenase